MPIKKYLFVAALFTFFALPAKAGILLDPYVGYELGTINGAYGSGAGTTFNGQSFQMAQNGVVLGARLGYAFPLVWAALDYMYGMDNISGYSGPTGTSISSSGANRSTLFADVGIKILVLRAYAGYGFMDTDTISATNTTTLSGSAVKLGVSFTGLPLIDLNVEYIMHTYNNNTIANSASNTLGNTTNNSLMVSVSVPFEF